MEHPSINREQNDKLLNAQDIAKILKVSKPQVYVMMRRGDFPVVKMGRLVRARASAIQDFIQKSTISMDSGP